MNAKAKQIRTLSDATNYLEGCMNDFQTGVSSKEETMNNLFDYTLRIATMASPIFLSETKRILSANFSLERDKKRLTDEDKNRELVTNLGNALTTIECNIKEDLKKIESFVESE